MPVETIDRLAARAERRGGAGPRRRRRFLRRAARADRRQPRAALRGDAPCRDRRRQAAPAAAHRRRLAPVRDRPGARAARRLRDRGDPRLFADPRRSAVHGRCRPAARQADRAQGIRRGGSGARRRQPSCARVRDPRRSGDARGSVCPLRAGARARPRRRARRNGRRADDGPRRRGAGSSIFQRSPACSSSRPAR